MPQRGKILYQWFQGGVGNHDIFLGKNQVAYAENVNMRDPEKVTLVQKAENFALTSNDLVLCKAFGLFWSYAYMWSTDWKMYWAWDNQVLCTTTYWKPIYNMLNRYSWFYWVAGNARIGKIDPTDMYSWDPLEWKPTYNENYYTSSTNLFFKRWSQDTSYFWGVTRWLQMIKFDNSLTASITTNLPYTWIWLWKTINYLKWFTQKGQLCLHDMANTSLYADIDLDWYYVEAIQVNARELLIGWRDAENTAIFTPEWEGKTLIAQSRLSWPDQKKVHYYGRKTDFMYEEYWYVGMRQNGNDTHGTYNNISYMINTESIACYGQTMPWMPYSWDFLTRNYNWDLIDEIWMIKVESSSAGNSLYYSWRVWTTCWVDKLDLDKVNKPDKFQNNWYLYTQKSDFWDSKARINKVKLRWYTTAGATIKVYCSTDGEAWDLKGTLNGTNPKKYYLLDANVEWYTVQRKIELSTDDEDVTPILYTFSFEYEIWDNE